MAKLHLYEERGKAVLSAFDDTHPEVEILIIREDRIEMKLFKEDDMRLEELGFTTELGDDDLKMIKTNYVEPM